MGTHCENKYGKVLITTARLTSCDTARCTEEAEKDNTNYSGHEVAVRKPGHVTTTVAIRHSVKKTWPINLFVCDVERMNRTSAPNSFSRQKLF